MILFFITVVIAVVATWFLGYQDSHRIKHQCNLLGSCTERCPWCRTFGFFNSYHAAEREYSMCKYCGKVQDLGKEVVQCFMEVCPQCFPDYGDIEKDETLVEIGSIGDRSRNTKKKFYPTWTMKPGHSCVVCKTKMVVFNPEYKFHRKLKEGVYKFHNYTDIENEVGKKIPNAVHYTQ